MLKLFNKILVPVDFSAKSKKAVEKAIDIATNYQCSIHLVHIFTLSPFAAMSMADGHIAVPLNINDNTTEIELKLQSLCSHGILLSGNTVKITCSLLKGTWDEGIIELVNENKFDLVLIGRKNRGLRRRKMMLNPDKIAAQTNVPVITIPGNRRIVRLYSIVIPITDFLPERKLMYGIYIASKYDTTIKLLGIENEKTKDRVQYFVDKAYELIKDNSSVRVETETIMSYNVAEAVNQFAMLEAADLVILNPGLQTKMPGFLANLMGNIIQKYAAPPVLTINTA